MNSDVLCGFNQLHKGYDLIFRPPLGKKLRLGGSKAFSKKVGDRQANLPALYDPRAREVAAFNPAVGEGNLAPQFWAPDQ